ncbi:hypothetical protein KJ940_17965 [Myxococcota bacterium]|nr:hypothetical protein [Myxococcota bacterium]
MPKPSWVEIVDPHRRPKRAKPCGCFALLGLGLYDPDGPVRLSLAKDAWDRGAISIAGVGASFCPYCGGALGVYRMEAVEAYRAFIAAAETLRDRPRTEDLDEARAYLDTLGGFLESTREIYHSEHIDARRHIKVDASWDPDHEHVYLRCSFYPGRALERAPFEEARG